MLLVILGAGASNDSLPRPSEIGGVQRYLPPLGVSLFDTRRVAAGEAVRKIRRAAGITGALDARVRTGTNVEDALESLQTKAERNPSLASGLAAVRYFLRESLWESTAEVHRLSFGQTNYATLLHYLEVWRVPANEQVVFLTFNYDRLVEAALETVGMFFNAPTDYVDRDDAYALVKVHGSIDWSHVVNEDVEQLPADVVRDQNDHSGVRHSHNRGVREGGTRSRNPRRPPAVPGHRDSDR